MSLDVSLLTECCDKCGRSDEGYSSNITHNLGKMADAAGIYKACWRPEEIGAVIAKDIIPLLATGVHWLIENPNEARKYDAENGWGTYEHFVPWVEAYLEACKKDPTAKIEVSR
jgi:hypothetical protein